MKRFIVVRCSFSDVDLKRFQDAKATTGELYVLTRKNKKDFDELRAHIKKGLTAHFVNYFDEVLGVVY